MSGRMALRRMPLMMVLSILVPASLSAQGRGMPGGMPQGMPGTGMGQGMEMGGMMEMMQGMMGAGMMGPGMMAMMGQGMGMMPTGGPGPLMILRMGDAFGLTAAQRTRLQAIQTEYVGAVQPLMAGAMEAHQEAAATLEGDSPDLAAYEQAIREAADRMVEAHLAMAMAAVETRAVLTDAQLDQLDAGMQMMMMGMMGGGQPDMMGPGGGR